jgi:hypothetical protein
MPISYDEVYKFDFDPKKCGVTPEFLKVDEEVVLN